MYVSIYLMSEVTRLYPNAPTLLGDKNQFSIWLLLQLYWLLWHHHLNLHDLLIVRLTINPPLFFGMKRSAAYYIQVHFRLDFIMEAKTIKIDRNAPDLDPNWLMVFLKELFKKVDLEFFYLACKELDDLFPFEWVWTFPVTWFSTLNFSPIQHAVWKRKFKIHFQDGRHIECCDINNLNLVYAQNSTLRLKSIG